MIAWLISKNKDHACRKLLVVIKMVYIVCCGCAEQIEFDDELIPLDTEVTCPVCETVMTVELWGEDETNMVTNKVKKKEASINELKSDLRGVWSKLTLLEKKSLEEATIVFQSKAFTASEIMTLRTLESVLRRTYGTTETLGRLLKKMEDDPQFNDLHGIIKYFTDIRNSVAHPDRISTKLEADSTLTTAKRLLRELIERRKENQD